MHHDTHKPSHDEWIDWAHVIVDRLTTCIHIYSKPPYDDVFMIEKERQEKNQTALNLLRSVHGLIDQGETPTESLADVHHHDERVIDGLAVLVKETLDLLPTLSVDMQKLLKSEWYDKCNGRLASELFRGPMGNLFHGIGSGYAEQGRLPEVLTSLLERERHGDNRQPRKELHRHDEDELHSIERKVAPGEPNQRRHEHVSRRWADKNSGHIRTAGRIE